AVTGDLRMTSSTFRGGPQASCPSPGWWIKPHLVRRPGARTYARTYRSRPESSSEVRIRRRRMSDLDACGRRRTEVVAWPSSGGQGVAGSNPVSPTEKPALTCGNAESGTVEIRSDSLVVFRSNRFGGRVRALTCIDAAHRPSGESHCSALHD